MKFVRAALFFSATAIAMPAWAGDEVLYADVPMWVDEAQLESEQVADGPAALLYDWQYRLEGGVVYAFTDMAYRLDNPQALMQQGTLSLRWLPDNGDLTIHRLEILRGNEVIDLVEQGVTFDVLRREQALEQRFIDGELTATLAVPGLREGDVLRVAYTVANDEPAFGDEVQAFRFLPSDPWQVGFSRVIVSWPAADEMYYSVEDRVDLPELHERNGYSYLELSLPLAERDPVPNDAPFRYRRPDILRVGSFSDWNEVSRVMAPHFEAAAILPDDSPLIEQAQRIMDQTADPLERMALATQLVQDEVSYLFEGLDGGGYLPQTPDETWANRYGDCKAKSVLLLSLLRRMGIESEVVLVNTEGGDAVPDLLPLPAFNHMIVHAVVDGEDYWLDGTSSASRLANIGDVLPFYWALPLREEGTGLLEMKQRDLAVPQLAVDLTVDHSAGTDFPLLFDMEMRISGPAGTQIRAMVDADNPEMLRQMARSFGTSGGLEGGKISSIEISYDDDEAIATIRASGVANSMFEWNDGRMQVDVDQGADSSGFNPDRARPAWREIPVATPGPSRQRFSTRLILPDGGKGYSLTGDTDFDGGFGNLRVERHASIEDGAMIAVAETFLTLGEIAPEDLSEAKRAARRLERNTVELATPDEVTWRWELSEDERMAKAAPIIRAYDDAIAFADPDDYSALQARALFLENIYAFDEALDDYTTLANETPSPWAYHRRSSVLAELGRQDEAIEDLQAAYDPDPQNYTAFALARLMA